MITLFHDQDEAIARLRQSMTRNKRILFRGETGFGKSVVAAYTISRALQKGHTAIFNIPRRELLRQMADTFRDFNIPFSYVASGKPFNPYAKAYLTTTGTLVNNLGKVKASIVFLDESHHGGNQLDKINQHFTQSGAWIVGLTATPDNVNLHKWYDDMVEGPNIRQLIDMKRLSDFRYFAPTRIDRTVFKRSGQDFNKGQVDEYMREKAVIVGDAVNQYRNHSMGQIHMAFCTSIKNSLMTAERFRDAGIPAVHMDGDTPEHERKQIARDFALRKILVLCSVDLALFGYDLSTASGVKNVAVEGAIWLRPSKSMNVVRQGNGRALRYKDFPATISDHVSNYEEHGMPDDEIEWSLSAKPKTKNPSSQGGPRVIQCITDANGPGCFYCYSYGNACPECGKPRAIKEKKIEEVEGELEELSRDQKVKKRKMEQGQARTLEDLIELGKKRGMKKPAAWASRVMSARLAKKGNTNE